MSSQYILSAIIPISNMAGKLANLESWYKLLSYQNMEVIFIHDKRDEITGIELKNLLEAHSWPNFKFVEGNFQGPGNARNRGLEIATGSWIVFWDADDIAYPGELLRVLTGIDEKSEIIIGNFEVMNISSNSLSTHKIILTDSVGSLAMNPGIWRIIFRKDKISQLRFPNFRMGEDQIFLSNYLLKITNHNFIDAIFYRYFIGNSSQLTNNRDAMSDLKFAARESLQLCKRASLEDVRFFTIMLERQILTGYKFARLSTKASLFWIQIKAFLILNPAKSFYLFHALWNIMRSKSRGMLK